jgi:hypothetical protein
MIHLHLGVSHLHIVVAYRSRRPDQGLSHPDTFYLPDMTRRHLGVNRPHIFLVYRSRIFRLG